MKEITDLTIKDLLSSNTSTNTLIVNQNFAQVKESILLIQSTFGLQIQNKTLGTPATKIFVGQVSADKIYLPNIGDPNSTANAKITFDGTNGNIKASGLSLTNDIYVGNDVIVGEKGKGGRVRLYTDRNTDTTKPPKIGEFRFVGPSFQGRVIQDEVPATLQFSITGGGSGTIAVKVNAMTLITVGSVSWTTDITTTSINLVNSILTGGNAYVTASYSGGVITISSLPGLSTDLNGTVIDITTSGTITTDISTGPLSGGIDGIERWITFGEGGSTGPTGPTGAPAGSSGSSGINGSAGSSGVSGSSGSSGLDGSSGSSGANGSSGSSGSSGLEGPMGPAGSPGPTGASGSSGSSGVNGSAGSSGSSGTSANLDNLTSFDVKLGDSSSSGFAWSSGYFTSWNDTYKVGDSLIDLDKIIKLLVPTGAPVLSSLPPMVLSDYYPLPNSYYPSYAGSSGLSINLGSSGTSISNTIITDSNTASAKLANMSTAAWTSGGGFDIEEKDIFAYRDATDLSAGGINYTTFSSVGPYSSGDLVVNYYDYWNGNPGKEGLKYALLANISDVMNGASYGSHDVELSWETGGTNLITTFYYDNPSSPSFSSLALSATTSTARYVSGVPSLSSGDNITVTATIDNAVSEFYLSKPLTVASSTDVLMTNFGDTVTGAQTPGSLTGVSATGSVRSNIYTEDIDLPSVCYNAKGDTGSGNALIGNTFVGKTMRADTVSNETNRYYSGGTVSTSPTVGTYGSAYDTTASLVVGPYLYELQLLEGYYGRLSGISYVNNLPTAGPDYSTDSNSGVRWVLFRFGPMTGISGAIITINGTSTTSAYWTSDPVSKITAGLELYAKVDDAYSPAVASSTWIDCNSPFITGTNPGEADGTPAMIGDSTTTIKNVTFGNSYTYSGYFWVRIGLPSGSSKKFTSISVTLR